MALAIWPLVGGGMGRVVARLLELICQHGFLFLDYHVFRSVYFTFKDALYFDGALQMVFASSQLLRQSKVSTFLH